MGSTQCFHAVEREGQLVTRIDPYGHYLASCSLAAKVDTRSGSDRDRNWFNPPRLLTVAGCALPSLAFNDFRPYALPPAQRADSRDASLIAISSSQLGLVRRRVVGTTSTHKSVDTVPGSLGNRLIPAAVVGPWHEGNNALLKPHYLCTSLKEVDSAVLQMLRKPPSACHLPRPISVKGEGTVVISDQFST